MAGIILVGRKLSMWIISPCLWMSGLIGLTAKAPVLVDIHTGVYNNSLVSSCLPTDSRNISAVHKTFVSLLRERNDTDDIWLPIQRRDLGGWYWLSGELEEMASSPYRQPRGHCAVLRASDMVLEAVVCDHQYHKYLCQKTDSSCGANDENCFVDAGTQYTIVEAFSSWYEAREGCYERGKQLASLPRANRRHLLEKIRGMTIFFPDIWVGLRRMDYFIVNENTSVEAYNWKKGNTCPCNSPHSCLALERTEKNMISWKPRNCSDWIASIVCDQRKRHEEATTKGQVMAGGEEATTKGQVMAGGGTHLSRTIVVLTVVVITLLVAPMTLGVLCWYKCQKTHYLQRHLCVCSDTVETCLKKDSKISVCSDPLEKRSLEYFKICLPCCTLKKRMDEASQISVYDESLALENRSLKDFEAIKICEPWYTLEKHMDEASQVCKMAQEESVLEELPKCLDDIDKKMPARGNEGV